MAIDLDAYRKQSRETWGQMATGWEDRREWLMAITGPVNDWLVDKADAQPGQTFLELAAGTGDLGFRVAERVGEAGRVISTDFTPEMVDVSRTNGRTLGRTNVEYRVMDAESMDLDDESVDGVVCRFGYMLMADPEAALKETRRVLRAGGRLAFAVWTTPDRNQWAAAPAMTLVQLGHVPAPEPGLPGMFAMGDPGRIRELVRGAGFGDPEVEEITIDWRYADFDDLWDALTRIAGTAAQAIDAMSAAERQATRAAIMEKLAQFRDGAGSYTIPGSAWGVLVR
jgi:ubiquinone/menaquinone biosynthesis C-methylase UbiE